MKINMSKEWFSHIEDEGEVGAGNPNFIREFLKPNILNKTKVYTIGAMEFETASIGERI